MIDLASLGSWMAPVLSYLLGSVCFGLLISRRSGINLRGQGSGNIGGTNVYRVMGKKAGLVTVFGDLLKGTVAVGFARLLTNEEVSLALSAFAVILGHNFPIFFGWKGGKGVATTFGALLGYMPWMGVLMALIWGGAFALSRISSAGALSVSVMLPVLTIWTGRNPVQVWFAVSVGLMMLIRHKDNMIRLVRGEEKRC